MKVDSSQLNGLNLLQSKMSFPQGLPENVAKECAALFPNVTGIVPGMAMDEFEVIMSLAASNAKNEFIAMYGSEFGDRRNSDSPLRSSKVINNIVDFAAPELELASFG